MSSELAAAYNTVVSNGLKLSKIKVHFLPIFLSFLARASSVKVSNRMPSGLKLPKINLIYLISQLFLLGA